MACEKCWRDANLRMFLRGGSVVDHYRDLLIERKDAPCSPDEQAGTDQESTARHPHRRRGTMSKPENVTCPLCNGPMVSRANKSTGQRFWGCRSFPQCKGTRNTDGESRYSREYGEEPETQLPSERQTDTAWKMR